MDNFSAPDGDPSLWTVYATATVVTLWLVPCAMTAVLKNENIKAIIIFVIQRANV